jgi:endonuclease-3
MTQEILRKLREVFGQSPKCELVYNDAFELLAAVILSAQCTDRRVNAVTPNLFSRYKTVQDVATAETADIEEIIRSCGCYKVKARHIKATAEAVVRDFGGTVPKTVRELMTLPGVGEKTASVLVAEFYGVPAIAVDTHVTRVAHRLGLSAEKTPSKIARDLEKSARKKDWRDFHLLLVLFGRYICTARNPKCASCPLYSVCPSRSA